MAPFSLSPSPSVVVVVVAALMGVAGVARAGSAEDRLIATKLKGYNPLARPVEGEVAVDLYFGMGLIQILQIVEKEQTVKSNVWLRMIWYDTRFAWDVDEYEGVPNIRLPFDSVWNPEIVLFNNANGVYEVNYKSNVVVYPDGLMLWVPPALFVSSCTIDVRYFPFDEQRCEMIFGSWTYNSEQVKMWWYDGGPGYPYAVMGDYARSGSWDVTMVPGIIKTDPKRKVTNTIFYLHLRRKTLFFIINLIIPCVVIAVLCWFTFMLPSTSGEKVGYAITLLLGLMVFLLLLFTVLPATSESVPLMAQFLLFIYIANVVTIILCVWIIGYSFRLPTTHVMSDGIRALFLDLLPRMIRMHRPPQEPHVHEPRYDLDESLKLEELRSSNRRGMSRSGDSLDGQPAFGSRPDFKHLVHRKPGGAASAAGAAQGSPTTGAVLSEPFSSDVIQAAKDVRFIAERASGNNEDGQVEADWRYIGLVLDQLIFLLSGAVILGGTCFFLMSAPNSFGSVNQKDLIDNWGPNHCRIFWGSDYKLYSHTTADNITIDTMKTLCCGFFFSKDYAEKSSKYSNYTADEKETRRMRELCGKNDAGRKRRSLAVPVAKAPVYVAGTRASGPIGLPAHAQKMEEERKMEEDEREWEEEEREWEEVEQKWSRKSRSGRWDVEQRWGKDEERKREDKERKREDKERKKRAKEEVLRSGRVDWEKRFSEMGLDFEREWKSALKANLALMRQEEDERRVEALQSRPLRGGLRNNVTRLG